jgi:hypothetical protein
MHAIGSTHQQQDNKHCTSQNKTQIQIYLQKNAQYILVDRNERVAMIAVTTKMLKFIYYMNEMTGKKPQDKYPSNWLFESV